MDHIKALAIKFISTLVILWVILGLWYDMSFGNVILITFALGIVSYIIGDLLILSRTNNTVATLADFGMAFLLVWLMGENITYGDSLLWPALISAAAVALFESFFHKYLANRVFGDRKSENKQTGNLRYQTEASDELTPRRIDLENNDENKS